ncbi:MAG TPA: HlyD family efflux transporter periplasmic adaptor subunit [Rudaea sp.]|nr:HlyD family efflux transporter periplasmic adaptor subunit [Rudaea sp.]
MRNSLLATLLLILPLPALAVVFAGEARSDGAQPLFVPPSDSSPVVLRYYLADGSRVKKGDILLRIDAGTAAQQILSLDSQLAQTRARVDKEVAQFKLKAVEADIALADAQAALDTANVDAAIPKSLISALDFDKHAAELARSQRDLELKRQQLADAQAAVTRREREGKLEVDKLERQRAYYDAQVDSASVNADRDGVLVHAFNNFFGANGGRYEEGSSAQPGWQVGEVVSGGAMSVRAWVLAPDRAGMQDGERLCLSFDALPGRRVDGSIRAIAGAPEAHAAWGAGSYFTVDITMPGASGLPLLPGMNVRAETDSANNCKVPAHAHADTGPVKATGEIYPRSSVAIMPPQVEGLWQMTVTQMAPDGQTVKKGEPLVTFDGGDLAKNLTAKQSELKEKQRQQDKLRLELAVKARNEELTAAEAAAELTKAQRKASQPPDYVPGVEYKKLLIARAKAQRLADLSQDHARAAAAERAAEQREADADVARLKAEVERLQTAMAGLTVTAPRDGIFQHALAWNGQRIDVGSQVWRGQSVGNIPDMATLAVRAGLPERDYTRVARGDAVRIVLDGGAGQTLNGRIASIGLGVHSKSRVEPLPVIDLDIDFDKTSVPLKPGQPVRIEILESAKKGSST